MAVSHVGEQERIALLMGVYTLVPFCPGLSMT